MTEARKNSWTTWLLSPITKKREETEEEKANIDRKRQERRIEKDLKERWLASKKTDLKGKETLSRKEKEEVNAADLNDDEKIRVIKARICARESRERQEKEKAERDRQAKIRKQQLQEQWEKREREAAAAAEQSRKEEDDARKSREAMNRIYHQEQYAAHLYTNLPEESTRHANTSSSTTCRHDGWWPKVQGHTACPKCDDIWPYLLRCPGCKMMACPRCQAAIRPRRSRPRDNNDNHNHNYNHNNAARTMNRKTPLRVRTPSPDYDHYYFYE